MSDDDKNSSVRVAVRIRPQIPREIIDMCRICTFVTPGEPQVVLGTDKAFTFDYMFDTNAEQVSIYSDCVEKLVEGALKGYNATVLAYGQTGSGKTFTMGTGFDRDIAECQEGIIPRAVRHIFSGIQSLQENPYDEDGAYLGNLQFSVAAQFLELYNEEIIDLLDPYSKGKVFKIHEDTTGSISVAGATIRPLKGPQDALNCLQQGALVRTTASTNMNELSSRSHALFTILIRRQRIMTTEQTNNDEDDLETLTSKFHFVDLAGSERLKRTGATGERAREGISINCGLLALGNVISALGDVTKKSSHVPYRDSKLTRLLQDSLGGNSQTVMLACISPSDRDFMETLNTLKYANRARNIKNRVQVNQDQSSRTISQLRREIAALQLEILDYKQGKRNVDAEGNSAVTDTSLENAMLIADNKRLQQRIKAMQETINCLTERNTQLLADTALLGSNGDSNESSMTDLIRSYIAEIEKLKAKLIESEQMYQQLKKSQQVQSKNSKTTPSYLNELTENPSNLINLAKRELERDRELLMSKSLPGMSSETENQERSSQDDGTESDSDTESDDKTNELQAEINDIQSDIEIKTKLIEQLELSQQRMMVMKQHYEEKLNVLSAKIQNTQKERDQVLANLGGQSQTADQSSKMKKVREEYERKLAEMQKELKKLHQAQKEHLRQQRELQAQDNQLKNIRQELTELKQIKIKLMRKMTEENNRHKEEDARRVREIAQLRKEARKQSNMIKSLQGSVAAKDQVLKRKTEEVSVLRKNQKSQLSLKAQGRVATKKSNVSSDIYNPRQARIKWENMQRSMGKSARSKQAVIELERELERLLGEREQLSRDLTIIKKRQKVIESVDLASEEDSIQANLNYIQQNIEQVQNSIMELEEGKESALEQLTIQNVLEGVRSIDEAKFLIEKLCVNSINQACDAGLAHTRLKEKEALLNEVQQDSNIQQQLLQHVLARNPAIALSEVTVSSSIGGEQRFSYNNTETSIHSSRSPSPINSESDYQSRSRRRRVAPMAQELLFGSDVANGNNRKDDEMSRSFTIYESNNSSSHASNSQHSTSGNGGNGGFIPLSRVPSAPGSLKDHKGSNIQQLTRQKSAIVGSPMFNRRNEVIAPTPQSPRVIRRQFSNRTTSGLEEIEMPPSPPIYRRGISREDTDVFSRLGAGIVNPTPGGSIKEFNGRMKVGSPLICTHIVDGHSSSVLSIKTSDSVLFTAAADRTCKVWDLRTMASPHCLSAHPGPVVSVEYDKETKILFSASGAFVRAWDLRDSNVRPIKTLCSSGVALSGAANLSSIPTGEAPITALRMGTNSGNLYTAASDKVRFWDLRMFSCIGKLSGGHQAAVMCLTSWNGPENTDYIATGSKDHYVKVFEVGGNSGGNISPLLHLEPPHYDGVQALVVSPPDSYGVDAELFSGSRDLGIKRWDLRNSELKQSMNNCHKGWVSGMTIYSDIMLSSCRGGLIRLWNLKTFDALAEMKTEASINDITCGDNRIFTASNSGEVRIWRLTKETISSMKTNQANK